MSFHFYDPSKARLFACAVCQRDSVVICRWMFGLLTFTCLCGDCARATLKKWPDAMATPAEVRP